MTCLNIACFTLAVEVVVLCFIFDKNAATKIIDCRLLFAVEDRPCEPKYVTGHLTVLVNTKLRELLISPALALTLRCQAAALRSR
jgi:hypothetical protein